VVLGLGCGGDSPAGDSGQTDTVGADSGASTTAATDTADTQASDAHLDAVLGLVRVPTGTFWMGSLEDEVGRETDAARFDPDGTRHQVTLTRAFVIGAHEVTQGLFEETLGYSPGSHRDCGGDCEVDGANWHRAADFLNHWSDAAGLDACSVCDGEGSGVECLEAGSPCDCTGYRPPTYPLVSPTRMGRPRCRRG
jgi:formylglycine-generating enzyme required for sulfatase activity